LDIRLTTLLCEKENIVAKSKKVDNRMVYRNSVRIFKKKAVLPIMIMKNGIDNFNAAPRQMEEWH
jgi:hypothetical protein